MPRFDVKVTMTMEYTLAVEAEDVTSANAAALPE